MEIKRLTESEVAECFKLYNEDLLTVPDFARLCYKDKATIYKMIKEFEVVAIHDDKGFMMIETFRIENLIYLAVSMEKQSEFITQYIGYTESRKLISCPYYLQWNRLYSTVCKEIQLLRAEEKEKKNGK
jgi:hypothetical protein